MAFLSIQDFSLTLSNIDFCAQGIQMPEDTPEIQKKTEGRIHRIMKKSQYHLTISGWFLVYLCLLFIRDYLQQSKEGINYGN